MRWLADRVVRRSRAIVVFALLAVVAAAVVSSGVDNLLSTGGNEVPGSGSSVAATLLDERGEGSPNLLVLITERDGLDRNAETTAQRVLDKLRLSRHVIVVDSAWDRPDDGLLRTADDSQGLIVASIGGTDAEVQRRAAEITTDLRSLPTPPGVDLEIGGSGPARADLIETTDRGLIRAELIALPLSLLILLYVFRTPVAAALPLLVAAVAILGTLATLRVLVEFVEVSIFARSVATAIGLAMAVDSSLFLVSRYRELRPEAPNVTDAVHEALVTSGPAILFSGLTTGAALAGLLAFSTPLLRSFAYAGVAVVGAALVGGLIVLPAAMTQLGERLDKFPILPRVRFARAGSPGSGVGIEAGPWYRVATVVSRRPLLIGASTLVLLGLLVSPMLRIEFGLNDDRVLPTDVESRRVNDRVRTRFGAAEGGVISVVYLSAPDGDRDRAAVLDHRDRLADLPGVGRVDIRPTSLAVIPTVEPMSSEGRDLVEAVRSVPAPLPAAVGGEAARLVDNTDHVVGRLPLVVAAMITASLALLGLLFRSVLLPIKAVLLNLLSLSAMFGAVVWVFQDGRFAGLLDYTPTGLTDVTVPMLMFAIAFGLAMDYEVYLLTRIREEYRPDGRGVRPERPVDTVEATARGLQRTGAVLSASAVLMSVVFLAFTTAGVTHLKVLGLGISLAVLLDAFVVRALLVPSFMTLAGAANWWPGRSDTGRAEARAAPSPVSRLEPTGIDPGA